jgi:hypothetical protein
MKKILALTLLSLSLPVLADAYGTYTVPVPAELAPFATFMLNDSQVTQDSTGVVVSYDLPAELVGPNHPTIVLGGKHRQGGIMILEGEYGEASCFSRNAKLECIVQYEDLEIDLAGVENILNQRIADPHERELRLQVAKIFGGEPVGIVEILP